MSPRVLTLIAALVLVGCPEEPESPSTSVDATVDATADQIDDTSTDVADTNGSSDATVDVVDASGPDGVDASADTHLDAEDTQGGADASDTSAADTQDASDAMADGGQDASAGDATADSDTTMVADSTSDGETMSGSDTTSGSDTADTQTGADTATSDASADVADATDTSTADASTVDVQTDLMPADGALGDSSTSLSCSSPGAFLIAGDSWTDISASLIAGTDTTPYAITLSDQTLHLCPGTYFATVSTSGTSVIEGNTATLNAGGTAPVVTVTGGQLAASDVTLTGGAASQGGGMYVTGGTVTLTGVVVTGNTSTGDGGGLWADGATIAVDDSVIHDNEATGNGGGVALTNGSTLTCTSSTSAVEAGIYGNTAADGGNALVDGSTLTLAVCDFGAKGSAGDGDPVDILTWNGSTGEHYLAGADASGTCTAAGCGTSQWTNQDEEWLEWDWTTGSKGIIAWDNKQPVRFETVYYTLRLKAPGNTCDATLRMLVEGVIVGSTAATTINYAETYLTLSGLDLVLPGLGEKITLEVATTCPNGPVAVETLTIDNDSLLDFYNHWGTAKAFSAGFGPPTAFKFTPEL